MGGEKPIATRQRISLIILCINRLLFWQLVLSLTWLVEAHYRDRHRRRPAKYKLYQNDYEIIHAA